MAAFATRVVQASAALLASSCLLSNSLDDSKGNANNGCPAGFGDCDGDPHNGCETDLSANPLHCGACLATCQGVPNATTVCQSGVCGFECNLFVADCDANPLNGCETPIEKDSQNCGTCGTVCGTGNATSSACIQGACAIACVDGFADCDQNSANGCESSIEEETNCGACGRDCLGGECVDRLCQPVTLGTSFFSPSGIAVTSDRVYVVTDYGGCDLESCWSDPRVESVTKQGEDRTTDLTISVSGLTAADDDSLFYTTGSSNSGRIARFVRGAAPVELATGQSSLTALALGPTRVFFLAGSNLRFVPRAGGEVTTLVTSINEPRGVTHAAGSLYFGARFSSASDTGVARANADDGSGVELFATVGRIKEITSNPTHALVIGDGNGNPVRAIALADGTITDLSSNENNPSRVVADASHGYWWSGGPRELRRAPISGGPPEVLVKENTGDAFIAVDATRIYWLRTTGTLHALVK